MKQKKLLKMFSIILSVLLTLTCILNVTTIASAQELSQNSKANEIVEQDIDNTTVSSLKELSAEMFGDIKINSAEYLYNLDGTSDYLYIEFDGGGYAVFLRDTMELMEHSNQGKLPYSASRSLKYYGGPGLYLSKDGESFINVLSEERLYVTESDAKAYASEVREMMLSKAPAIDEEVLKASFTMIENESEEISKEHAEDANITVSGGVPAYDRNNLIRVTNGTYIPNYRYFLSEPLHGENETGSCSSIAAQLMLSYHNYYSDRRIIENRYLNGDNNLYNQNNPNYCEDPMLMTPETLGSRGYFENGQDDPNSYFAYVIEHVPAASDTDEIKNGLDSVLQERNNEIYGAISYSLDCETADWSSEYLPVESDSIIEEIDSGRPVILITESHLGGSNHAMIAYGYSNYNYSNSNTTYLGFITHFGWKSTYNESFLNIWVNSAWCYGYVTLNINHTHNYQAVGSIGTTNRTEYKCNTCGHRTDAYIKMSAINRYVEKTVTLPHPTTGYTYQDFYVTFSSSGKKLFQTFGAGDAMLFLYDTEYNELISKDGAGYWSNALFSYTVEANKPYILRVKFYFSSVSGDIKVGITPASSTPQTYTDIWNISNTSATYNFTSTLNTTQIMTFMPTQSGTYTFKTSYSGSRVDTYLYIIDPTSTSAYIYDDDSGGDLQASVTTALTQGRRYFIIVSPINITNTTGNITLNITKNS